MAPSSLGGDSPGGEPLVKPRWEAVSCRRYHWDIAPGRKIIERDPRHSDRPTAGQGFEPLGLEELEDRAAALHGDTQAGREASKVVRALVKAARSIVLYEAGNQAVAGYIAEFRERMEAYLADRGALDLVITPYEISSAGEVIYIERDLERSLAVRLYTDGVRRLTVTSEATWEELARLVGTLAVRFKGIRQQEDDVVTLLWKAELQHIHVEAVAGFVSADPDEDPRAGPQDGSVAPRNELQARVFSAPYTFDYPAPPLADPVRVQFRPLTAATLARLEAEEQDDALITQSLGLAEEVLAGLEDQRHPVTTEQVMTFFREVRDGFLAMGRVDGAVHLGLLVAGSPAADTAIGGELMESCLDRHTLEALAAGGGPPLAPEALRQLSTVLSPDQATWLLEMAATADAAPEGDLLALLEVALAGRASLVHPWIARATAPAACALLALLGRLDPQEAVSAAIEAMAHGENRVQHAALAILATAPYSPRIGRALTAALDAGGEEIRMGALKHLVRQREGRALPAIHQRLHHLASGSFSAREAGNLGAAMALLAPAESLKEFAEWVRPGGLLHRVVARPPALLWAAAGGLAKLGGPEAEALLEKLAGQGSEELQQRCRALLERRRQGGEEG